MDTQHSFFADVPPRGMGTTGHQFIEIMRGMGSRPEIQPESAYNRLVIREYYSRHPATEFLLQEIRSADSLEKAVEFFADWILRTDVPAADTIVRSLRSAKQYLRERGELDRQIGEH